MTTKTKLTDEEALARLERLDPKSDVVRDRTAVAGIEAGVRARNLAEHAIEAAVRDARSHGVTWTEIAAALGVSHQAAMKKYRDRV